MALQRYATHTSHAPSRIQTHIPSTCPGHRSHQAAGALTHSATMTRTITHSVLHLSDLVSSDRRALASKLRGPGFKSQPAKVGGLVTIIMWGARPG